MSVTPSAMRRIMRELGELQSNPPEGVRVQTNEEDMLDITGIVKGPESTPYAGGYFRIKFKFTDEFPAAPPKCWFTTKIFHPNVSSSGEICVNTLKKDWKSSYGIGHILVTVKCLLIYPNPESALDEEAGKLLLEDYKSYCDRAKLITSVHATPKVPPVEFDTPSSPSSDPHLGSTTTPSSASSKRSSPAASLSPAPAVVPPSTFTLPIVTRKTSSSTPAQHLPLTSSPSNLAPGDKETPHGPNKDRHPSPAPLSTADANVSPTRKASSEIGTGPIHITGTVTHANKAVKRAAVGGNATAEKRKKALKRL